LKITVDRVNSLVNARLRLAKEVFFGWKIGEITHVVFLHVIFHLSLEHIMESEQL
jgi:hypothetical protein